MIKLWPAIAAALLAAGCSGDNPGSSSESQEGPFTEQQSPQVPAAQSSPQSDHSQTEATVVATATGSTPMLPSAPRSEPALSPAEEAEASLRGVYEIYDDRHESSAVSDDNKKPVYLVLVAKHCPGGADDDGQCQGTQKPKFRSHKLKCGDDLTSIKMQQLIGFPLPGETPPPLPKDYASTSPHLRGQ